MKAMNLKNILRAAVISSFFAGTAYTANCQALNVTNGKVTYNFPVATMGEANFSGSTISILGKTFDLAEYSRQYIGDKSQKDNTVKITYTAESAEVTIAGNIARYVEATVSGANVKIAQSPTLSDTEGGEITYILSGTSAAGSFYLEGSYKSSLELDGLQLTNPSGAAIDIQNGKRIDFKLNSGTVNTLEDGAGGTQKGALVCKGHLEFKGKGSLEVKGNASHAIYSKEYVDMKNCNINITGAKKDGLNCNQYFMMESGTLKIRNTGDDGMQVSFKDDTDREAEDTGCITILDGTLDVEASATATKAIKCDGDMTISGGKITALVTGGGKWDATDKKTKAASCLSADGKVLITGGSFDLKATGGGGKGLSCDGTLEIKGGNITIATSGGMFAYVNGIEYQNYTGNADRIASDQKSSPKGIKVDGAVTISGGVINVTTSGSGGEGIESKDILTIIDGTINVKAYDDAINSSSHMYVKGGETTVISTNNDGLDANGNIYIEGGRVMAFGGRSPECGLDANEEEGYTVYFTGGTVLAVGGGNSVPKKTGSTQPFVQITGTISADKTITLQNGTSELATFTVPSNYSAPTAGGSGFPGGSSSGKILITCHGLTSGQSYTVVNGTTSTNATAQLTGTSGGRP